MSKLPKKINKYKTSFYSQRQKTLNGKVTSIQADKTLLSKQIRQIKGKNSNAHQPPVS